MQRQTKANSAYLLATPKRCAKFCSSNPGCGYLGVFLLALLVRGLYLLEMKNSSEFAVLLGDARLYDTWAQRIASGDWFGREVFFEVPLYPYFVAVIYKIIGPHVLGVRLVQIVLGAGACTLVAMAGQRFFSIHVRLLAGAVLAIYPPAIFFDGLIQKSALDLLFMALLLFLLGQTMKRRDKWMLLLSGFVLSSFVLTRENALVLFPLVVVWLLVDGRGEPLVRRLQWAGAFAVGTASLLLLVGCHNRVVGGTFQPTTASVGVNFYYGNSLQSDGRYFALVPWHGTAEFERVDKMALAEAALGRKLTPGEMSQYWWEKAKADIRSDPGRWGRLLMRKWALTWNGAELMDTESILLNRQHSLLLRLLGLLHFGVICPLALVGVWLTRSSWRQLWLLYGIVLGFAAAVALFIVSARYRFPMVPVVVLFAAAGFWGMVAQIRSRAWATLGWPLILLVASGLCANWPLAALEGDLATAHTNLGVGLLRQGAVQRSVGEFKNALRIQPSQIAAKNNLAWIYATHANPEVRRGAEAVVLASAACRETGFNDPVLLDTLAAAYAETGRFAEAAEITQRGVARAVRAGQHEIKAKLEERLELYKAGRPYRTPP